MLPPHATADDLAREHIELTEAARQHARPAAASQSSSPSWRSSLSSPPEWSHAIEHSSHACARSSWHTVCRHSARALAVMLPSVYDRLVKCGTGCDCGPLPSERRLQSGLAKTARCLISSLRSASSTHAGRSVRVVLLLNLLFCSSEPPERAIDPDRRRCAPQPATLEHCHSLGGWASPRQEIRGVWLVQRWAVQKVCLAAGRADRADLVSRDPLLRLRSSMEGTRAAKPAIPRAVSAGTLAMARAGC